MTAPRTLLSLTALAFAACSAPGRIPPPVRIATPSSVESSIFLVGDAGHESSVPVLTALGHEAATAPASSVALFLGDNVYEAGLPPVGASDRAAKEQLLRAQLAALPATMPAIFVPGNHDWSHESAGGLDAIRREGAFIASVDSTRFAMLPRDGCPGPSVRDVGGHVRIVALDTQWWLHTHTRVDSLSAARCTATDSASVVRELRDALASAAREGRRAIVIAHHPLISGGPHGGHAGGGNPIRRWLHLQQDVGGSRYRSMIASFRAAFSEHPPLAYASGHDHDLQLLRESGANTSAAANPYLIVSGAGSPGDLSGADSLSQTLFALGKRAGFMRLDVLVDGRALLRVYALDAPGSAIYARWLE